MNEHERTQESSDVRGRESEWPEYSERGKAWPMGKGHSSVGVYAATIPAWSHGGTSVEVREKQRRRSLMVATDGSICFWDLYGLLHNADGLFAAYGHVKRNAGSKTAGCDGITMKDFAENFEGNFQERRKALEAEVFERFCRKVRFLGQNPKIGYQEFNELQTPKLSKKQLCDRTMRSVVELPSSRTTIG